MADSPHGWGMGYVAQAADVAETLAALNVARCVVFGHSMGGKVAMRLALDWPALVAGLVVGDIAPVAYAGGVGVYVEAMRALELRPGLRRAEADAALAVMVASAQVRGLLLQNLVFHPVPAWSIGLDEIAAGMGDILGWDETGDYAGRTLFLVGGRSEYGVAGGGSQFKDAKRVVFPEAGHWIHIDAPEGVAENLQAFAQDLA